SQFVVGAVILIAAAIVTYVTDGLASYALSEAFGDTAVGGAIAAGVGAAAGDATAQGLRVEAGMQQNFNGWEVLAAGAAASATAGIGALNGSAPGSYANTLQGRTVSAIVSQTANGLAGVAGSGASMTATQIIADGALTM